LPDQFYSEAWYESVAGGSLRSARTILKIVNEALHPKSVIDVGCGTGTWLKAWSELGVEDIFGIDGEYVRRDQLLISADRFQPMDLSAPTQISRQFELVESLEVAEHLPSSAAEPFVAFLTSLGSVVLFSAAIPNQGGVHHINEQWPEFWAELFSKHGFLLIDTLRDLVWDNPEVDYWYCQNTFIFVREGETSAIERLRSISVHGRSTSLGRVHPRLWLLASKRLGLSTLVKMIPGAAVAAVRKRLDRRHSATQDR
jgi:hypothetical protein